MSALVVDTDPARLDRDRIHAWLSGETYWARDIPREVFERALDHSLCFGAYLGARQIGFARWVTDQATFAYLADVFIDPAHRGLGHSRTLMDAVMAHPAVQGVRRMMLVTRDAHGVYEAQGFTALAHPDRVMERHRPDVYRR